MLTIPENIKELFKSDNTREETRKYFKLSFQREGEDTPWLVIENDKIVSESLKIDESLSSDEDLVFGSCEGAEMQITVADITQEVSGEEFTLTVNVDGYEVPLGIYTVDSFERQSDRRRRKIVAYDRMAFFNVDVSEWYNRLSFPMTLKTFRNSLCDYIGVPVNNVSLPLDSMQISKTIEPEQLSGTDVLTAICEINGCFGHFDKYGKLKFILLQQTGLYPSEDLFPAENLYPSEFGGDGMPVETISVYKQPMIYEDYLVDGITGLTIRQEEGDVGASVGEGKNPYVIEGNFLVYGKSAEDLLSVATTIFPYIYGRTYRPASLECNCRPWLEVGDAFYAPTREDIVETFVMKRTIYGCQAMKDKIEATGNQTREADFSLNRKIIQLEGKTAVIVTTVEEVSATVTDLKSETESQLSVLSSEISAEVTRAKQAESSLSVRADGIELSVTNLSNNTSSQIEALSDQISLKVSVGQVSSQLSVESGEVRIESNRLTWSATNSSMSSNGTLTCNNAHVSGEINAGSGTIGGNVTIQSDGIHINNNANGIWLGSGGSIGSSQVGKQILQCISNSANVILCAPSSSGNGNLVLGYGEVGDIPKTGRVTSYEDLHVGVGDKETYTITREKWAWVWGEVVTRNVQQWSSEDVKEDIVLMNDGAISIVENSKIYKYKYKSDRKEEKKDSYGFVIERETPEEIICEGGKTVDLYSMVGILWKAVQELDKKVEEMKS